MRRRDAVEGLHGRDAKAYLTGKTVAARFNYDYSDKEIGEVAQRARKLAERSILEGGKAPDARLDFAFRLAAGRAPDSEEKQILRTKLDEMLSAYQADVDGARSLVSVGASPRDPSIPVSELAGYTAIANMILNLDEVITKD